MRATMRPIALHFALTPKRPSSLIRSLSLALALTVCPVAIFAAHAQDATAPATGAQPAVGPMRDTVTWTTFKGDNQRSGTSAAKLPLPLNLLWRFTSDGPARPYRTTPLVLGPPGQQRVYLAIGRNILCVDSQTGQQIWKSANLYSLVVTPITLLSGEGGDYILAGQQNGRLTALRTADGGRAWEVDVRSSLANAGPIIANTGHGPRIICAIGAGRLIAYTLDGQLDPEWEVKLGRYGTSPSSSMALSADGNQIFLTGSDGRLYAADAQKGALLYSIPLASTTNNTPVTFDNQVVVATSQLVSGMRATAGDTVWSMNPRSEVSSSPAVGTIADHPVIYFGTQSGIFYAVGVERGNVVWKTDIQASISGSPLVLPNMVIFGTRNGQMVALNPVDGTLLWRYRLKTERQAAVAVATTNPGDAGGQGGGDIGAGGGTPDTMTAAPRIYGVSGAPCAVNGQLFVLGDNASVYAFTSLAVDASPPRAIEPSLALPDEDNKITSLLLAPDNPPVVPGRGPMYLAIQLDDTGSGVDPSSLQVLLDGAPIPAASINFQVETGNLTATLLQPDNGTGFVDGLKNITLIAKDYAGNLLQFTASFSVDNQAPPPPRQQPIGIGDANGEANGANPNPGAPAPAN